MHVQERLCLKNMIRCYQYKAISSNSTHIVSLMKRTAYFPARMKRLFEADLSDIYQLTWKNTQNSVPPYFFCIIILSVLHRTLLDILFQVRLIFSCIPDKAIFNYIICYTFVSHTQRWTVHVYKPSIYFLVCRKWFCIMQWHRKCTIWKNFECEFID